jgi:hypothetical protein
MENAPERFAPGAIFFAPRRCALGELRAAYFAGAGSLSAISHCTCTSFSIGFTAGS